MPPHILITGASSGLGAALALQYAAPGVKLSLHGRAADRLAFVATAAEKLGATVMVTTGNVTDTAAMKTWITESDALQPITLVIANAGISAGTSSDRKQVDAIFAVNLQGVLNTIHPAIELMKLRGQGQVAIMSSLASFRGFSGSSAYCASKAAVRVYGEALRADLAGSGIRVNVICPGFIKTPMTDINTFRMPFLMTVEKAAERIQKGLEGDQPRIAFPLPMCLLLQLAALLPQGLVNRLMSATPRKPAFDVDH